MGTNQEDIKKWLENAETTDTHMIVVCDTYDYTDYPVYVGKNEFVYNVKEQIKNKEMTKIMEVYNLEMDFDYQLNESRAFHY